VAVLMMRLVVVTVAQGNVWRRSKAGGGGNKRQKILSFSPSWCCVKVGLSPGAGKEALGKVEHRLSSPPPSGGV